RRRAVFPAPSPDRQTRDFPLRGEGVLRRVRAAPCRERVCRALRTRRLPQSRGKVSGECPCGRGILRVSVHNGGRMRDLDEILKRTIENMRSVTDCDAVVGKPVRTEDGTVMLPVSRVSYGF